MKDERRRQQGAKNKQQKKLIPNLSDIYSQTASNA